MHRFLEKKIELYLDNKEIMAIVGARQSGKTTLMRYIYNGIKSKNKRFITFEDRDVLELFIRDIKGFIERYIKGTKYLFIDEFQYAKQGGKQLKYIYDTQKTKILISGSSVSDLSIQSIKYLVGRIFVFQLDPFSFEEYLSFKDEKLFKIYQGNKLSQPLIKEINKYYEEFVIYGGYPRVILSKNSKEKEEVLKNIYNTYFLKEVKEILQLSEDFKLSKLIKVLALQVGGLINYNELCLATGFNYKDLLEYLNILKKTFICIESRPFFSNKKKELVKAPRLYFLDNGLRNFVIKNFQRLEDRSDSGSLNENFIASELIKKETELKYWKTKAGAEVDFIIEHEGKIIPLEVKSNLKSSKLTRSFRSFLGEYESKQGFIFSWSYLNKVRFKKSIINFNPLFSVGKCL